MLCILTVHSNYMPGKLFSATYEEALELLKGGMRCVFLVAASVKVI